MFGFGDGVLGVLTISAAIIAVKTLTSEYWAWRARRDLSAKRVLDALADDGRKSTVYDQMLHDLYTGQPKQTPLQIYPGIYTDSFTSGTGGSHTTGGHSSV